MSIQLAICPSCELRVGMVNGQCPSCQQFFSDEELKQSQAKSETENDQSDRKESVNLANDHVRLPYLILVILFSIGIVAGSQATGIEFGTVGFALIGAFAGVLMTFVPMFKKPEN